MQRVKHIFWDWNGTLLNDVDLCISVTGGLLHQRHGGSLCRETYLAEFGFPVVDFYRKIGFSFTDDEYSIMADEWIASYRAGLRAKTALQQGVTQVLPALKALGYAQSILSACEKNLLLHSLENFALLDHFRSVHGMQDNKAHGKSSLAREALREVSHKADECLLIGDTEHDHQVAEEVGLHCILIAKGHQNSSRLRETGRLVLDDIRDLPQYLKERKGI